MLVAEKYRTAKGVSTQQLSNVMYCHIQSNFFSFITSNLLAIFTICFEKLVDTSRSQMGHAQLVGCQFDMPGLFDYTELSVPLTFEHHTGWSVNWI
jgi:hypothetical protein